MLVLFLAVIAPLAFAEDVATFFGLSVSLLGPISLAVATVAAAIFSGRNGAARLRQVPGRRIQPQTLPQVRHGTAWMAMNTAESETTCV